MVRAFEEDAFKSEDQKVPFDELLSQISKSKEALQVEFHNEVQAARRRPVSASSATSLFVNPGKLRPRSAGVWAQRPGITPEAINKVSTPEATGVFYGVKPANAVPDFKSAVPSRRTGSARPNIRKAATTPAVPINEATAVPRPVSRQRNLSHWAQERVATPVRTWPVQGADASICDTDRNGLPPWKPTCTDHRGTSRHPNLSLAARPRPRSTSQNRSSRGASRPPSAY
mmetsp:Transcript_90609/g.180225  ORF Transcript_90609/g.180225 Transcript_90609/m.180225 type:complete len:229 (+) Transcript_90609:110-796(+)